MSQKNAFFEWPQPSGILSDINFDILFGILPEVSSSIQPNIRTLCLIVSLAFYLEKVLPFYLTSSLALLLSDIYSCILSGLCHICWYSICLAFSLAYILASHLACIFAIYLTFYLAFCLKFYLAFFLGLPCDNLFFYISACGIIWHFISHVFGHSFWDFICSNIETFHLAFFLTFLLAHVGVRVCPYSDLELAINIINLKFSACLCTGFEA